MTEDFTDVPQIGPSINRKGGVRLHPVRDGVLPMVREGAMRHRDQGGNLLTEVTNPQTGMCEYVTSPLMTHGVQVIQPTPIVPVHNPKRDAGIIPQFDSKSGTWYIGTGNNRRTIRTVSMGDSPLPTTTPRRRAATPKGTAQRLERDRARATGPDRNPNGPTRNVTFDRSLVDAYIIALAKKAGQPLPKITKEMRRLAKAELERQQDIQNYCKKD